MEILRWGIVGCGNISSDFVIALRLAKRNHKVVAAASRSIEKATKFAKKFSDDIRSYGNYSDLFKDDNVG
jgi:predicted dehydrogenase